LPAAVRYTTESFFASVLLDIERDLCDGKRRKALRSIFLHLDDAPARNAKRSRQEIAQTKANRVAHPNYLQEGAASDFVLLGYLKREMAGFTGSSAEDIPSEIRRISQKNHNGDPYHCLQRSDYNV
jgi:hypothetical protein